MKHKIMRIYTIAARIAGLAPGRVYNMFHVYENPETSEVSFESDTLKEALGFITDDGSQIVSYGVVMADMQFGKWVLTDEGEQIMSNESIRISTDINQIHRFNKEVRDIMNGLTKIIQKVDFDDDSLEPIINSFIYEHTPEVVSIKTDISEILKRID